MTDLLKAYNLGKRLALHKFAEETDSKVDNLTEALDSLLEGPNKKELSTNVLDSSERASSSSWGDKMELETPKNTGLNV